MTDEKKKKDLRTLSRERNGKKRRKGAELFLRKIALSALAVVTGYLFSGREMPFGTYPLGLALICSSENYIAEYLAGILIKLIFGGEKGIYLPFAVSAVCACLRYSLSFFIQKNHRSTRAGEKRVRFFGVSDDLSMRAAVAAAGCFIYSLCRIVSGGKYYDLFAAIFFTLVSLALTFMFSFAFDIRYKKSATASAGRAALVFCSVYVLTEVSVMTISLGIAAAYIITLTMGYAGDGARGTVAGLLVGAAVGGEHALVLAFTGLAAGIFADISRISAVTMPVCVSVLTGLYFLGGDGTLDLLPEALLCAIAAGTLDFFGLLPDFPIGEKSGREEIRLRDIIDRKREEEKNRHAAAKVNMLSSLSETIKSMSESLKKPDKDHLSDMCREVFGKFCEGCPKYTECRASFKRGLDVVDSVTERLMKSGKIAYEKYGEILTFGCPKKDAIVTEINLRASKMLEEALNGDKTGIFAFDYSAAARIIADTVAKSDTVYAPDEGLTALLSRSFSAMGISAENLVVCGDRKKYVIATGKEVLRSGATTSEIRILCESVCGGSFTSPEYAMADGGVSMTLESTPLFEVEYAGKQCAKKGEKVCGDAIGITESREDFFYGFICDGMGSGREAGITARIGKTFLEKMLSCGNSKATTLDMLNMFISNKNTECSSTVDLLEIDLLRGKASFTKSGAAASYIARGGNVYKISSDTMPLGLLPEVCAEVTDFTVCDGDVIVMCSDGICDDPETDEDGAGMRLVEFLEKSYLWDVEKIAERIVFDTAKSGGRQDDMTVGVFRVKKRLHRHS